MTPYEVENVARIFRCCFLENESCLLCPLNDDDKPYCKEESAEIILKALKRLHKLESPTKKEQPTLPIPEPPISIEELQGADWNKEKSHCSEELRSFCPEVYDLFTEFRLKNKISFVISTRCVNAIRREGIWTVEDFLNMPAEHIPHIRNIGKKSGRLIELVQEYARNSRSL